MGPLGRPYSLCEERPTSGQQAVGTRRQCPESSWLPAMAGKLCLCLEPCSTRSWAPGPRAFWGQCREDGVRVGSWAVWAH